MSLSDTDRGKLDKVIDMAVSLAPTLQELAANAVGKEVMKVSNARDFVLGGLLTFVITGFVVNSRKEAVTQDESFEILRVVLTRFAKEISMLVVVGAKSKKQSAKSNKEANRKTKRSSR